MQSEAGHDRDSGTDAANNEVEFHFSGQGREDIFKVKPCMMIIHVIKISLLLLT